MNNNSPTETNVSQIPSLDSMDGQSNEQRSTNDDHVASAQAAQQHVDEALAVGDYDSAAYFREIVEKESELSGDTDYSDLSGSTAAQLHSAADHQSQAAFYEDQFLMHLENGDYAAAENDALMAENSHQSADNLACGEDHSWHARMEAYEMDLVQSELHIAEADATIANEMAAQGDFENAQMYADMADSHIDASAQHLDQACSVESSPPISHFDDSDI